MPGQRIALQDVLDAPRWLAALCLAWLVAQAGLWAAGAWLGGVLGAVGFFALGALGLGLLATCLAVAMRDGRPGAALLIPVCALLALALAWLQPLLVRPGLHLRFRWHEAEYQRVASQVRADPGSAARLRHPDAGAVHVDPGPPVRVGFRWEGAADNWSGVVYDPTGLVGDVDRLGAADQRRVRQLFGGQLLGCLRLRGSYYHCDFT